MNYPKIEYKGETYMIIRTDQEWYHLFGGYKVKKNDPAIKFKVEQNMNFEDEYIPVINPEDEINKPEHYHRGGIDVIGFSEQNFSKDELRGFYRINVLKYVTRYEMKGGQKDLDKAAFYINKLKELEAG